MGSSRNLFLLFVLLFLILSSHQVAPSNAQTTEHIDKKSGKGAVHLPNTDLSPAKDSGIGLRPLNPGATPKCKIYGSCLNLPPKPRRCNYANMCRRPCCGKAQEFTKDQFKDDFHN